jgi:putative membrane protein
VKYLSWLLKSAVFFTVFAFALNNQDDVRVHFFFGNHWDAPLVLVVLATLTLGVVLGIAVMVPLWLKARKARAAVPPTSDSAPLPHQDIPPHGI